jgi:Zn finger protein HypA/HybF involved in hydrogenase expression
MRKLTFEFVKAYVEKDGTKLRSTEYIDSKTPLDLMCSKRHEYSATFSNFKNKGTRCPICAGNVKYTFEEVKAFVEADGTKLLSLEYINVRTKLNLMCPKSHKYTMTLGDFKNGGQRCPECSIRRRSEKLRFDFSDVKAFVEADGTTLRSQEYVNCSIPLEFKCPKGHKYSNNFDNFKNKNQRCPKCARERLAKKLRFDFSDVKTYVEADGTTLCSSEYVNCDTPLDFMCPKGHEYSNTFSHFKNDGQRCPRCSGGPVSKISQVWLDQKDKLHPTPLLREHRIIVSGKKYKVDALDLLTKTVYEFLGGFYHGNPARFKPEDMNLKLKKSYGQLHKETFERILALESAGYKVVYIWEKDFQEQQKLANK